MISHKRFFDRVAAHDFGDGKSVATAAFSGGLLPLLADGFFFGISFGHGLPPCTEAYYASNPLDSDQDHTRM